MPSLKVMRYINPWGALRTAILLAALIFAVVAGNAMHGRHYPLVEAIIEVKLEVTLAHLWFEVAVRGDSNNDLPEFYEYLDLSDRSAKAMLSDSETLSLPLIPLLEPALVLEIEELVAAVANFREIAEERWMQRENSGVGSPVEQRFTAVFNDVIKQADDVEIGIHAAMENDHRMLLKLQILLIAACVLLAVYIGILINRFERQRLMDLSILADSRERMKLAIAGADLGTWDWDVASGQVVFNERWATMLGFGLEEIEPHLSEWEKRVHPADLPEVMKVLTAHLAGETPFFATEYRLLNKSGEWVWVLDRGTVIERGADGRPLRACGTHLDITPRKQAEAELEKSFNQLEDMVYERTIELRTMVNAMAGRENHMAGLKTVVRKLRAQLAEAGMKPVADDTISKLDFLGDITKRNQGDIELEETPPQLESLVRERSVSLAEQSAERNLLSAMMNVLEDLQASKTGLEASNRALVASNKDLDAFSYSVSHDLRAPLRHIAGFVDLLRESSAESLDPDGHRLLNVITKSTERMGSLIDDLLDFSHTGRVELKLVNLDLQILVGGIVQEAMAQAKDRDIDWEVVALPEVHADWATMRQVFVNLIDNAVKYTRKKKQARIQIGMIPGREGEQVFFVKDDGVGFDMDYVDKLFSVFQRLHSQEEFEGSGIGLALVRQIVHRHGGQTWAKGSVGGGATFFFSLPLDKTGKFGGGTQHRANPIETSLILARRAEF